MLRSPAVLATLLAAAPAPASAPLDAAACEAIPGAVDEGPLFPRTRTASSR